MEILNGFKVYTMAPGSPVLTLTKNGIGLSKATLARLDNASHVQIMFDSENRLMAIKKCDENDEGSVPFYNANRRNSVRWNNRELCVKVARLAQENIEPGFRVEGEAHEDEGFIIFDLKKKTALT